jgi:hypothetical protein
MPLVVSWRRRIIRRRRKTISTDWYDTEHIPERLRIKGFTQCACAGRGPAQPRISLAIYDLDTVDILRKPEYHAVSPENFFTLVQTHTARHKCVRLCTFQRRANRERAIRSRRTMRKSLAGVSRRTWRRKPKPNSLSGMTNEHIPRLAAVPGVLRAR